MEKVSDTQVKVSVYPFESGYAVTLAHPLRRLLMSSSTGFAPIAIKIEGATHEFDSVRGMLEDVATFIVNLKNIRFKIKNDAEQETIEYNFEGHQDIKGANLNTDNVEVVTPDAHLVTLNDEAKLKFTIVLQKGIGYVPSEDTRNLAPEGFIAIDAFFTPVRRATYSIEKVLVEDDPNYEKIVFDIKTDGQIEPQKAFEDALGVMYSQLKVFNKVMSVQTEVEEEPEEEDIDVSDLLIKIDDLNLTARSFNSLDRVGIKYLGEIVLMSEAEIKNIKNLGKRSCDEIAQKLEEQGYPMKDTLDSGKKDALLKKLDELKS
jgi:DNA-directed RNA polymerase subunit alpha